MCDLTELQKICIKFQSDLREWFDIAHSLVAIASIGQDRILEILENNDPSYTFSVPINTTLGVSLASINKLQHSEILKIYLNHSLAITELVFGRIIQIWYDFLNQAFEQILKEVFAGSKDYSNVQKLISGKNVEEIPKIVNQFDRGFGVDKIEKVENYLGRIVNHEYKERIGIGITVRNLLEHNQGFIRDSDLDKLKSKSIKLINQSCQEQDFLIGEKVEITIYEVFRLKQAFYYASKQLILD